MAKELELFRANREINYQLNKVTEEISKQSGVVNVISNFQPVGYKIDGLTSNRIIIFMGLGMILMSTFILLIKLNQFLENYEKQ